MNTVYKIISKDFCFVFIDAKIPIPKIMNAIIPKLNSDNDSFNKRGLTKDVIPG